jgi:hypothetical protein
MDMMDGRTDGQNDGRADGQNDGRADGQTDSLPDRILAAARELNHPPEPPREEIWARIQAEREGRHAGGQAHDVLPLRPSDRPTVSPSVRLTVWITGIAALLAVGIGIGRLTIRPETPVGPAPGMTAQKDRGKVAYSVATGEHLSRVETLLTSLRTGQDQAQFSAQARELLTSTRLLLDSRAAEDPKIKALLQDLELILVQVGQLNKASGREELDLLTDGLEQRQVMPRLRNAIPAGPARQL